MYGLKFKDAVKLDSYWDFSPALQAISRELKRANRSYLSDNLDPRSEGNYLQDFLRAHGEDEAVPIKTHIGTAHAAGRGVEILDLTKERRRLEDALRKNPTGLAEMLALWDGIYSHR